MNILLYILSSIIFVLYLTRLRERGSRGHSLPKGRKNLRETILENFTSVSVARSFRVGVADDRSRLGVCSIIEPSLHHPFVLQCGLDVPTVPRYYCTLPLTIPNDAKEAFAKESSFHIPYARLRSVQPGLTTGIKRRAASGKLTGSSSSARF